MRYHIWPVRNAVKSGVWPGSTPKSPSEPGSDTSSTSWVNEWSGVTMLSVIEVGRAMAYCFILAAFSSTSSIVPWR